MKLYCLSGLGADERVFQHLNLSMFEVIHVQWIDFIPNESLVSYAHRLGEIIDDSVPFALMGLSFGGMLAIEIAKQKTPKQLFLISTMAHVSEKPLRMKVFGKMGAYNFIPASYFNKPSKIAYRLFGAKAPSEKKLLDEILADNAPKFIKWALNAISNWNNTERVKAIRIHGTKDKLFPFHQLKIEHFIQGGGHLMVISHAAEINEILQKEFYRIQ